MKFEFKPSFDRSVKSLPPRTKEEIKELCINLIDVLSGKSALSKGLGLRNLRRNYWEIRKGLKLRIIFHRQDDMIEFLLAGSHDDIKRFLKE
jgi:mRNA-degrading endonuclease RelE of RelBE toxin-antitoxin system